MSILINGVSIPDRPILIKILPNETAIIYDDEPYETDYFEINKPHGDLIDRDSLLKAMYDRVFETDGDTLWQSGCWIRYRAVEKVEKGIPSIIPAERSEE